jgi:hypothetical protein
MSELLDQVNDQFKFGGKENSMKQNTKADRFKATLTTNSNKKKSSIGQRPITGNTILPRHRMLYNIRGYEKLGLPKNHFFFKVIASLLKSFHKLKLTCSPLLVNFRRDSGQNSWIR